MERICNIEREQLNRASKVTKNFAGSSITDIQARLSEAVDRRLANAIDRSLDDIDTAVKGAMLHSIGIKARYGEYEFNEPNGQKSPARIIADNKMLKVLEQNAGQWAQDAFDQSIEGMRDAAQKHFKKEFERFLKITLTKLAENAAHDISHLVLHEAKTRVNDIISEVIQPQQLVSLCKDGNPDLFEAEAFATAAGVKALATLAEDF